MSGESQMSDGSQTIDVPQWHWHQQDGQQWLTCDLLQDWPHSFGSSYNHPHKADRLAPVQLGLSGDRAAWAVQVHGNAVLWVDRYHANSHEADAVATDKAGDSVWVRSADCVPVAIAHRDCVCAIHSGWRGTAARIVPEAIAAMARKGAAPAELKLAIGPAISGPVYQVSDSVARQVLATISSLLHSDIPPVTYPDSTPNKIRLDLRAVVAQQAIEAGVLRHNIGISPHCTYGDAERFFSYRRLQNPPSPVQWSGIGLPQSGG